MLSSREPVRVTKGLAETCIEHQAELLVSRRLSASSGLISGASPIDFDPDRIKRVVAAVAGGPHSVLAARMASRMGHVLDVPSTMFSAYASDLDQGEALATIEAIAVSVPNLEYRLVESEQVADVVEHLGQGTLLVMGASGGSWFQRIFFGPGAKLRSEATAGAVVVTSAPLRVFESMQEPVCVGPMLRIDDLRRTHEEPVVAVVIDGILQGIVECSQLDQSSGDATVGSVMEPFDGIDAFADCSSLGPAPIPGAAYPVVGEGRRLVGSLRR